MIRFEDILATVQRFHPNEDLDILRRAYVFSAKEHHGQMRKSGEPYFNHPLAVAEILAEMKLDAVCVTVGLLHDVVEDTAAPLAIIEEQFGKDVANIVNGLTKINQFQFYSKEEQQAENFRKMFLAMVDDVRIVLVKLADRLHNMRTLQFLPPEKRHRISLETMEIYAPIAHRLGMGKDARGTGGLGIQLSGARSLSGDQEVSRKPPKGAPGVPGRSQRTDHTKTARP